MRGVPEHTISTLTASLSESTMTQYMSCYKKWWSFCHQNDSDPWHPSPTSVIIFLQHVLDTSQVSYNSINSFRSALALLSAEAIGTDSLVTRFVKGVYKLRPPAPRYDQTWDPQTVLSFLDREITGLEGLSEKLVTLLLLATGQRLQTISLIRIDQILVTPGVGMEIKIPDFVKTSGPHKCQPLLKLPFFQQKPHLCVASLVQRYLSDTLSLRPDGSSFLFVTHKWPHKIASKATLSRWVSSTLKKSGIDTSIFRPHSTRHATSSAALRSGLSIDTICKYVGWSTRSETFARFYNRPLSDKTLMQAVF
uniref:Tyr recombinase domain-containing protein n=3 Tax=Lygus hesperus TaxID=30085 RepID=A0A0K8T3J0_LYGHE